LADAFAVIFTGTGKRWHHNSVLLLDWFVSLKNNWCVRNNVTYVILVARLARYVIWRKQESASKQSYSEVAVCPLFGKVYKDFSFYIQHTRESCYIQLQVVYHNVLREYHVQCFTPY